MLGGNAGRFKVPRRTDAVAKLHLAGKELVERRGGHRCVDGMNGVRTYRHQHHADVCARSKRRGSTRDRFAVKKVRSDPQIADAGSVGDRDKGVQRFRLIGAVER